MGIDAYFPLNLPNNADVKALQKEWEKQLSEFEATLWQRPIIVTEVGILPIAGAYHTPYAWSLPNGTYDPQAQINYLEATYNRWMPKVDGIYWWVVTLGRDPSENSFSPLGLPTEDVFKCYFLKNIHSE